MTWISCSVQFSHWMLGSVTCASNVSTPPGSTMPSSRMSFVFVQVEDRVFEAVGQAAGQANGVLEDVLAVGVERDAKVAWVIDRFRPPDSDRLSWFEHADVRAAGVVAARRGLLSKARSRDVVLPTGWLVELNVGARDGQTCPRGDKESEPCVTHALEDARYDPGGKARQAAVW